MSVDVYNLHINSVVHLTLRDDGHLQVKKINIDAKMSKIGIHLTNIHLGEILNWLGEYLYQKVVKYFF